MLVHVSELLQSYFMQQISDKSSSRSTRYVTWKNNIFAKGFILNVWLGSENTTVTIMSSISFGISQDKEIYPFHWFLKGAWVDLSVKCEKAFDHLCND